MGTEKHKVEVIKELLDIYYPPEMLGMELKKSNKFVQFVYDKLNEGYTEQEIRNLLTKES